MQEPSECYCAKTANAYRYHKQNKEEPCWESRAAWNLAWRRYRHTGRYIGTLTFLEGDERLYQPGSWRAQKKPRKKPDRRKTGYRGTREYWY